MARTTIAPRTERASRSPRPAAALEPMGYDLKTAERVRRILSSRSDVAEKRMVGGLSFIVDGSLCCGVTGSSLMVRVGAEARGRALARPRVRPMEFAGRPLSGFVLVDPEGFRTEAALAAWVQRGIDFVATLQVKQPAARRPRLSTPRENRRDGQR